MGLIKKVDVPAYFAARRAMRMGNAQPINQPKATVVAKIAASGARAKKAMFKDDFSIEHSSPIPLPAKS
jgi:hypothetical protein